MGILIIFYFMNAREIIKHSSVRYRILLFINKRQTPFPYSLYVPKGNQYSLSINCADRCSMTSFIQIKTGF